MSTSTASWCSIPLVYFMCITLVSTCSLWETGLNRPRLGCDATQSGHSLNTFTVLVNITLTVPATSAPDRITTTVADAST